MRAYLCKLDTEDEEPVRILTHDYSDAEEAHKYILRIWGYSDNEIKLHQIIVEDEKNAYTCIAGQYADNC